MFKKGETVQLKSGGPIMTVEDTGDFTFSAGVKDGVKCVWFEGSKVYDRVFDAAALAVSDNGLPPALTV